MDPSTLISRVRSIWEKHLFLDYTIHVEDQTFRVHKLIVASVSDFFNAMLTGSLLESEQDSVVLKGPTGLAVNHLVQFMYTGQLALTLDNLSEILNGAVHLQILPAIEICKRFMLTNLHISNYIDIIGICRTYCFFDIIAQLKKSLKKDILGLIRLIDNGEVQLISYENLSVIIEMWPLSEYSLFHWAMHWITTSIEPENVNFDILCEIRYGLMKPSELCKIKESFKDSESFHATWLQLVDKALSYHKQPIYMKMNDTSTQTKFRCKPTPVMFDTNNMENCLNQSPQLYVLKGTQWQQNIMENTSNCSVIQAAVLTFNNFLIVCDQHIDYFALPQDQAQIHVFDPRTMTWSSISGLKRPRESFAMVQYKNELYVLGGDLTAEDYVPTNSVEKYNFETNEWTEICTMPTQISGHSLCVYEDSIYVFGGWRSDPVSYGYAAFVEHNLPIHNPLICLNIPTLKWRNRCPLPQSQILKHYMGNFDWKDEIFVIFQKGQSVEFCIEGYRPSTDEWTFIRRHGIYSNPINIVLNGSSIYFLNFDDSNERNSNGHRACERFTCLPREDSPYHSAFRSSRSVVQRYQESPIKGTDVYPVAALLSVPQLGSAYESNIH